MRGNQGMPRTASRQQPLERDRRKFLPEYKREHGPANTLLLDLQPLELKTKSCCFKPSSGGILLGQHQETMTVLFWRSYKEEIVSARRLKLTEVKGLAQGHTTSQSVANSDQASPGPVVTAMMQTCLQVSDGTVHFCFVLIDYGFFWSQSLIFILLPHEPLA